MAKIPIGDWSRNPETRDWRFLVCYCAKCNNKIYYSREEANEFIKETENFFTKQKFLDIIKGDVKKYLPKVEVKIGWGGGIQKSYPQVNCVQGIDTKPWIKYNRIR